MSERIEQWKQVEEIYARVLASPPGLRAVVLAEECPDDPDVREEVESLLLAREEAGDFLSDEYRQRHMDDLGAGVADRLGPYEILSPLGAGAMGKVFRARDTRLNRIVALKVLHAHLTDDPERVSRFQREAKAASALNHPNIVTIFDIGSENGTWYIAAELVEGSTLRERMTRGPIPVVEAIGIVMRYGEALETAHQAGIVHRDIKPENLMLRPDGVVKIVDFGLARISPEGEQSATRLTLSGTLMGTPSYMPPEQARGQTPDARSDVFSLGAVLYEMVAGRPAFPGSTAAEVFAALLDKEPTPTRTVLDGILSHALEKDRASRYRTMHGSYRNFGEIEPTGRRRLWTPRWRAVPRRGSRSAAGTSYSCFRSVSLLCGCLRIILPCTRARSSRISRPSAAPSNIPPFPRMRAVSRSHGNLRRKTCTTSTRSPWEVVNRHN